MAGVTRLPGRPRLDDNDRSVSASVKMPGKQFDAVCQRALRDRVSVPEVIRRALDRELRDEDEK
jgi:hypothetical protein